MKYKSRNPSYNLWTHLINMKGISILDSYNNYQKYALPIFYHEYVHFYLQFHSFFHLEGYIYHLEEIEFLLNYETLTIPLNENPEKLQKIKNDMSIWNSRSISNISSDNNRDFVDFFIRTFEPEDEVYTIPDVNLPFKKYYTLLENNKKNTVKVELTEQVINEGIAYTTEFLIDEYHLKKDEFVKSNLIYKIIPTIFANGKFNLFFLLLLCDLSLQTYAPGEFLIAYMGKYFDNLREGFEKPLTYELKNSYLDIYRKELQSPDLSHYHNFLFDRFNNIYSRLKIHFKPLKLIDSQFNKGLNHVLDGLLPEYMIPLIESGQPEKNIADTFREFKPPVTVDQQSDIDGNIIFFELFEQNAEKDLDISHNLFFSSLEYIRKYILYNEAMDCPIFNICKKDFKSQICKEKPWKIRYQNNTCDIGSLFNIFKIPTE